MNEDFLQPAATLAAVLLQRIPEREQIDVGHIKSAFLTAYAALEDAQDDFADDNYRATKRRGE